MALGVVGLWVPLVQFLLAESGTQPAPAVIILPLLFVGLAILAFTASLRDEPILLVVAGGLSFVPIGLFLLFLPGFSRGIGALNLGLVAVGILLLRLELPSSGVDAVTGTDTG